MTSDLTDMNGRIVALIIESRQMAQQANLDHQFEAEKQFLLAMLHLSYAQEAVEDGFKATGAG